MLATSSPLVFHSPSLSCSPSILFVLLLWLALWWKNFVFLFPASSQIDLNFCHQKPSSWCSSSLISFFTTFILSTFCPKPPCTKSANSLCSASNMVLYYYQRFAYGLLHAIRSSRHFSIFSKRQYIGLPPGWAWLHDSRIMFSQWDVSHTSPQNVGFDDVGVEGRLLDPCPTILGHNRNKT